MLIVWVEEKDEAMVAGGSVGSDALDVQRAGSCGRDRERRASTVQSESEANGWMMLLARGWCFCCYYCCSCSGRRVSTIESSCDGEDCEAVCQDV